MAVGASAQKAGQKVHWHAGGYLTGMRHAAGLLVHISLLCRLPMLVLNQNLHQLCKFLIPSCASTAIGQLHTAPMSVYGGQTTDVWSINELWLISSRSSAPPAQPGCALCASVVAILTLDSDTSTTLSGHQHAVNFDHQTKWTLYTSGYRMGQLPATGHCWCENAQLVFRPRCHSLILISCRCD